MVSLKEILNKAITDREAIIYLLIENGKISQAVIGDALGMSRENIRIIYEKAKKKVQ